jgi:hypothetical protein
MDRQPEAFRKQVLQHRPQLLLRSMLEHAL